MNNLPVFPTRDGLNWQPKPDLWQKIVECYGNEFARIESNEAILWLIANPTKGKTSRGMAKYLTGWLARARKRAQAAPIPNGGYIAPGTISDADVAAMRKRMGLPPLTEVA